MKVKLSVPSKTFLIGEYLALFGGPSLVVNTAPRFEMIFTLKGRGDHSALHPDSPAGRLIQQNSEIFDGMDIEFIDPFAGSGGLGASSAEFVMVHCFSQLLQQKFGEGIKQLNPQKMWITYRELHENNKKEWLPSGADVVSQMVGGICEFEAEPFRIRKHPWNFENIGFVILKTGNKIKTHEHLRDLGSLETESFRGICKQAIEALVDNNQLLFVKSIEQFHHLLQSQNLVCRETLQIVNQFKSSGNSIAIKGCGALGTDTLLVICEKTKRESIHSLAPVVGLTVVADDRDLASGLSITYDYQFSRQHQAIQSKFIDTEQRVEL